MSELEKALDDMHRALCKLNHKDLADALIGYVFDNPHEFGLTEDPDGNLINEDQTP